MQTNAPKQPPKTALKLNEAPKQSTKKGGPYLAALLATKPGGQEWQTVPLKPSKAQRSRGSGDLKGPVESQKPKEVKPVKEKSKEIRRLLLRRDEGQEAVNAERADIILAINQALVKEGFPGPYWLDPRDEGFAPSWGDCDGLLPPWWTGVLLQGRESSSRTVGSMDQGPTRCFSVRQELPKVFSKVVTDGGALWQGRCFPRWLRMVVLYGRRRLM
jgi:hypothetical protein